MLNSHDCSFGWTCSEDEDGTVGPMHGGLCEIHMSLALRDGIAEVVTVWLAGSFQPESHSGLVVFVADLPTSADRACLQTW